MATLRDYYLNLDQTNGWTDENGNPLSDPQVSSAGGSSTFDEQGPIYDPPPVANQPAPDVTSGWTESNPPPGQIPQGDGNWTDENGNTIPAPTFQPTAQPEATQPPPQTPAPTAGGGGTDPVRSAVLSAFSAKGLSPRDESDVAYWVNKINTTNGGWANEGNKNWWLSRMAQGQGGVGDYLERPEGGTIAKTGTTAKTSTGGGSTAPYTFSTGGGPATNTQSYADLMTELKKLFPDGGWNTDLVNRNTESAAEQIRRFGKQQNQYDESILASRGTIGDGPQITAQNRLEQDLADKYSNAVTGIYSNETNAANSRMISALQMATGLTESEATNLVNSYNAETNRGLGIGNLGLGQQTIDLNSILGMGNLALGNKTADNNFTLGQGNLALGNMTAQDTYNLGLGSQGVQKDQLLLQARQGDTDAIIELLKLGVSLDQILAGGYV